LAATAGWWAGANAAGAAARGRPRATLLALRGWTEARRLVAAAGIAGRRRSPARRASASGRPEAIGLRRGFAAVLAVTDEPG
jgi:hypothetical protein